jgi:hypothetical protein
MPDWYSVSGTRVLSACHYQVPGHSCHSGDICKKSCYLDANKMLHETTNITVVSLSGMIRSVKMAIFFGSSAGLFHT